MRESRWRRQGFDNRDRGYRNGRRRWRLVHRLLILRRRRLLILGRCLLFVCLLLLLLILVRPPTGLSPRDAIRDDCRSACDGRRAGHPTNETWHGFSLSSVQLVLSSVASSAARIA